jgi:hypothetical protein
MDLGDPLGINDPVLTHKELLKSEKDWASHPQLWSSRSLCAQCLSALDYAFLQLKVFIAHPLDSTSCQLCQLLLDYFQPLTTEDNVDQVILKLDWNCSYPELNIKAEEGQGLQRQELSLAFERE